MILAALLCAGGLHGVVFPAAAEAADPITVTGVNGDAHPYEISAVGGSMTWTITEGGYYYYHPADASVTTLTLAYTAVPESDAQWIDYDGAYAETGEVTGHTVNVNGENTRYWSATGGDSLGGAVTRNRVTVSGGEGVLVYGGYSVAGNVADNTVIVSGGTVEEVIGGYSETGNVTVNTVTVSGGSVLNNVYGGIASSEGGIASGNKVEISGGEVAVENLAEYGDEGYARVVGGGAYKAADKNEVTISGGTVGNEDFLSDEEAAPVYIVAGGDSVDGSTGNTVTIKGDAEVYANAVVGGFTGDGEIGDIASEERVGDFLAGGDAAGNQVTVEANAGSIGTVCGGLAFGGNATGNAVTLTGGFFGKVYGGLALSVIPGDGEDSGTAAATPVMGNADNNTVNISGTAQAVVVFGGAALPNTDADPGSIKTGTANNNTVTVSDGLVLNGIYGGVASCVGGIASGNKVEISGGEVAVENLAVYGDEGYARVVGGTAYKAAEKNEVTISGGTVGTPDYLSGEESAPVNIVVSGDSVNGSTGNTVTIKGNATVYANAVIGGFTGDGETGYIASKERMGNIGAGGDAVDNRVTVEANAGSIERVYGGLAFGGNATGNTVTLAGGSFKEAYGGSALPVIPGDESDSGTAAATPVMGNADNNTVNISGTAQAVFIYGGSTVRDIFADPGSIKTGTANNNTVNISGGTFGGTVKVTYIDGSSDTGYLAGYIYGGISSSEASGNTVNISGGNLDMATLGGGLAYSSGDLEQETQPQVNNNTVNVLAPLTTGALLGGVIERPDGLYDYSGGSGNTLNVAAKNVKAVFTGGFQNMNFYLPRDVANGDTMLTVYTPKNESELPEGGMPSWLADKYNLQEDYSLVEDDEGNILSTSNPTDLTGVTFGVAAQRGADLAVGDTVNLIVDEQGLVTDDTLKTTASMTVPEDIATDTDYQLSISKKDANTIVATVAGRTLSPNNERMATTGKSTAETRAAVATQVNAGADLIAGMGMQNAADAAAAENSSDGRPAASGTGGFAPFAVVGGSSLRAQSGSHVDTKGIGLALGFARELKNRSGKLLIGPLVEYGHGRYDSYQDDGTKADGKSHYWGFGIIAKQTNDSGVYYEGSLRIGKASSDYGRDDAIFGRMSYDSDSTYWGAHLGIGRVKDIGHDNTLDYYGKYFYSHTGGDSVFVRGLNAMADFGSVDSHRLRVGARVTHAVNEKNRIYGGLAYQYEFNGDARVTYNPGGTAPSPSVKGSSGMLELGWQVKPGRSPMVIDLGVTGWVGKQRGITANLQALWTF